MIRTMRSAAAVLSFTVGFEISAAQADITIERSTTVEGVGALALGNMTGTSRTIIAGDKSRTDTDTKMASKIVGFLARNAAGPSAEIILLDEDKLYRLNINKKQYTETSFGEMHAQLQKASGQLQSNEEKQQQPSAVDQSKCQWLPPKASIDKTGEKAQIAGYDSERVTITASQPCQDKETGSICEVALVLDEWLAPGFVESSEVRKFYGAYASKMGMDSSSAADAPQKAQAMFSQYKGIWTEITSKMQNMKGYPVRSSFTLALGGAQCKDSNAEQSGSSQPQSAQIGDALSGGGIAGAVVGKLGGLFHKNKADADAAGAAPSPAVIPVPVPPGDVALMTVTSQLTSVSTNAVSDDAFVVPAGFKKQELKSL